MGIFCIPKSKRYYTSCAIVAVLDGYETRLRRNIGWPDRISFENFVWEDIISLIHLDAWKKTRV